MQRRRFVALTVSSLLSASLLLSACGSDPGTAGGTGEVKGLDNRTGAMESFAAGEQFKATEPIDFSLLFSDHPNYPFKADWMLWSEITKRTNVTLDATVVPMSDYSQKRSLLIGAGDAPYIIAKTYPGQEDPFVASGAILPVSDYLDLMPNLSAKIKDWGLDNNLNQLRQADGKFYVLPGVHEAPWQDYTIAMRTDVLDQLGIAKPTSWDEFRKALEAIKKAHPDGYPFSDRFSETEPGGNILGIASLAFGTNAGWAYNSTTWDGAADKFVPTVAMPEYKALVEYFNGLVADGLMDPESFTQKDDAAIQKFVTGKSFAISTNAQTLVNDYVKGFKETLPEATVDKIPFPCGPAGCVLNPVSKLENGIMISSKAADDPHFVALMQFVDWLFYSDAGQEFTKWGVEGETYTKDADGKFILNPDISFIAMNPGAPKHLQKDFGFSGGNFAYGGKTSLLWSTFSDGEVAFQKSIADYKMIDLAPPTPLTEIEQETASLQGSAIKDTVVQGTLQFILGQRPMGEWDAFLKEVDAKGLGTYVDLINTAHERFVKENG